MKLIRKNRTKGYFYSLFTSFEREVVLPIHVLFNKTRNINIHLNSMIYVEYKEKRNCSFVESNRFFDKMMFLRFIISTEYYRSKNI